MIRFNANSDELMPDPRKTRHDETLTAEVRGDLPFLAEAFYVWVDEDGRIFVDGMYPLSNELRSAIESAGYQVSYQPTVRFGHVQYKLAKITA